MVERTIKKYILRLIDKFPIISLSGPRQSGKTTLLRNLFPDYYYINLENLDERALLQEDIRGFLDNYSEKGLIIDEAQRLPELFSYLQGVVDESGIMGKIILSGSQNFLLMEKITQSLAGVNSRIILFLVPAIFSPENVLGNHKIPQYLCA